jgi:hypothetical protein
MSKLFAVGIIAKAYLDTATDADGNGGAPISDPARS